MRRYQERRTPDRWQDRMKWSYKLGVAEFEAIIEAQGGGCAICGGEPRGAGKRFHIDHDHTCCPRSAKSCGSCVRGLLCSNCNTMLGLAGEDSEGLLAAVRYLQESAVRMADIVALRATVVSGPEAETAG